MSQPLDYADSDSKQGLAKINFFAASAMITSAVAALLAWGTFPIQMFAVVFSVASAFAVISIILLAIGFWRRTTGQKSILMVATVFVVVSLTSLINCYHRAQQERGMRASAQHLRGLGIALKQYADSNGSKLPDSLGQLVLSGLVPADHLAYPGSGQAAYVYLGYGKKYSELSPDDIIAYEAATGPSVEGVNVLAADGHTEWITTLQLKAALATPHNQLQQFHQ